MLQDYKIPKLQYCNIAILQYYSITIFESMVSWYSSTLICRSVAWYGIVIGIVIVIGIGIGRGMV